MWRSPLEDSKRQKQESEHPLAIRPTVSVHRSQNAKLSDRAPGSLGVKVGFPAGKTGGDIIEKAVYNHFGTSGGGWGGPIPERPFMTSAMRDNREKYRRQMRAAAERIVTSEDPDAQMRQELERLGFAAVNDIKREIVSLSSPPNSPLTVALKGSSNPLIDSGELHNAVTWEIENG